MAGPMGRQAKTGEKKSKTGSIDQLFGTSPSMVVKEITNDEGVVVQCVAKDDKGLYVTEPRYISNSGIADPNRYLKDRSELTGYEDELN